MNIDLSIIVPVYNVENYIARCLESLINQNYDACEIIVVDDGSLDNSISIAESYQAKSDKIKIVHKENGGLSSARNYGMQFAQGKYIWFVDSDDWIEPDIVGLLVRKMIAENLDTLLFNANKVFDDGRLIPYRKKLNIEKSKFTGIQLFDLLNRREAYAPCACFFIYRKDFLEAHQINFIEGIYHEDEPYAMQVLSNSKAIGCLDNTYYYYRQRSGSITEQILTEIRIRDLFFIIDKFLNAQKDKTLRRIYNFRAYCLFKTLTRRIRKEQYEMYKGLARSVQVRKKLTFQGYFSVRNVLLLLILKTNLKIYWLILKR